MCWTSYEKPIMKVAEEDITVIKVVKVVNGKMLPFYGYNKLIYEFDKEYPKIFLNVYVNKYCEYTIDEGYHSHIPKYMCFPESKSFTFIIERLVCPYFGISYSLSAESRADEIRLVECVIPKGTACYLNERGDYVSETIKLVKTLHSYKFK